MRWLLDQWLRCLAFFPAGLWPRPRPVDFVVFHVLWTDVIWQPNQPVTSNDTRVCLAGLFSQVVGCGLPFVAALQVLACYRRCQTGSTHWQRPQLRQRCCSCRAIPYSPSKGEGRWCLQCGTQCQGLLHLAAGSYHKFQGFSGLVRCDGTCDQLVVCFVARSMLPRAPIRLAESVLAAVLRKGSIQKWFVPAMVWNAES
jgi:hypothetical protein